MRVRVRVRLTLTLPSMKMAIWYGLGSGPSRSSDAKCSGRPRKTCLPARMLLSPQSKPMHTRSLCGLSEVSRPAWVGLELG